MKLNNTSAKTSVGAVAMIASLILSVLSNVAFAQGQSFTFMGDYDRTFAAPLGYYVDPEDPDPTIDDYQTLFYSGEYLPDGSIIAGGRHVDNSPRGDFYLRKFTPSGAVNTSFGINGVVRATFFTGVNGTQLSYSNDIPSVLKVQPDGKILLAGQCSITSPDLFGIPTFGTDACLMRFNPDGSVDSSFGNVSVMTGGGLSSQGTQNLSYSFPVGGGRFMTQTGVLNYPGNPGPRRGTGGRFYDMAIQPDGKIVLVGDTLNEYPNGNGSARAAFIMRLNANGTLDNSFGTNGIVQMAATQQAPNCYPGTGFQGVRLQADGRILALGYASSTVNELCYQGNRFAVTRWTANGQLETIRYLDNNTAMNYQTERATTAFFTRDGSKILVSGSYDCKATLVRLNVADLSVDTTYGTNGIRGYAQGCGGFQGFGSTLYIKAIQPDGKIIGVDTPVLLGNFVRFNPDGSNDQSFGNESYDGTQGLRGRLRVLVTHFNGVSNALDAGQVLVRPNGRINLIGYSAAHGGLGILRAVVSQQNTVLENGIYSDFENDGKTDLSVFRNGAWYWLNSSNNQFNGTQFGQAGDKPVPADYDGDGKTDVAVYRQGAWYISQSSNNQFRAVQFGLSGDLPRPGDFDGDGRADICVFRPSSGTWYILYSSNNQFNAVGFGANGDVPLLADFDGDGRSDISVYRNGTWYWLRSSDGGFASIQFGQAGDVPVVGDYDGDSKSEPAVFRPSNGIWYSQRSQTGFTYSQFGQNGDVPVPGDYDNDGKNDLAVYRSGNWYVLKSGDNSFAGTAFGSATDVPVPAAYLP